MSFYSEDCLWAVVGRGESVSNAKGSVTRVIPPNALSCQQRNVRISGGKMDESPVVAHLFFNKATVLT